ncbi:MAG TPA: EAL domain-containing protein [Thermoanaerobaculia bacterium]|nr:EAL domain-containing protein [Thermoanaerobaculia bacterium]
MHAILQHGLAPSAIPTALTAFLMLVFGGSVIRRRVSRVTSAFLTLSIAAAIWLLAFTLMYSTAESAQALWWAHAAYLGIPFVAAAIYHFTVEMLRIYEQRKFAVWVAWSLAAFFAAIGSATDLLVPRVDLFWWGYYPRYRAAAAIPFLLFFFGYLMASLFEYVRAYPKAHGVERKRIRMLIVAFIVAYVGCVDYLPKFGVAIYPFGYIPILGFVMIVAWMFRRYDLLALTPSIASQEIISTMADALFVCDAEGRIQFANRAAGSILGYAPNELLGRTIDDLVDDPEGDASSLNLRPSSAISKERTFVAKNGERVEMMLSIAPVLQHGESAGAVLIGRDIRDRKENERQIRKAVMLLESTLDSTADGILVVGDDGKILSYNQRFLDMWRIPKSVLTRDDWKAFESILDQLSDPEAFLRSTQMIEKQPYAESYDLVECQDGRRFERYSAGRRIEGVANARVWSFRDVTAKHTAEEALRDSELRYRLLFEQNAAGVCVTKLDGEIVDCNVTFASMLGYDRAELIGNKIALLHERPAERAEIELMLQQAKTVNSVETELRRKTGGSLYVLQNLTLAGDRIHMTVADISDRKRAEEQIEFHAYHDVLTHLPNRKLFTDRLSQNLTHARRTGKPLAVMFVDLDHFKSINDTLGHTAGDELLLEMARRLRGCVREDDTVARLGGDEFTIILSELRHPEDAVTVAEKIIKAVQKSITIGGMPIDVSASIGIALYPVDGNDPESLLRNADSAMYRAKESGRNTYQLCTDEMKGRALQRLSLESKLRRAVQEQQLVLHYQPQVSLGDGKVIGAEALLRWNDPERGYVYPASFIPVAEESRLILPIGEWVLRTACTQMREWRDRGLALPRISINLSPRQFQQQDLVDTVRRVLEETGLEAKALEIEITEGTAMANAEASIETLHALRELGCSISIDDFGTGYSSLNYLKRFPITCVKVDSAFVRDLTRNEGDAAIVSAVIAIARSLKLRVIAEGVETEEQLAFLRKRKCDAAQGYYFSRPVEAQGLAEYIGERRTPLRAVPRLQV